QIEVVVPLLAVAQITLSRRAAVTGFDSALVLRPEALSQMAATNCHPHTHRKHDEDNHHDDRNDDS
ncbi:hypothetical protein ABZS95_42575, partial [Streptomyces sp. NPDC005479]|uniref:hypothetical protein n=1 Tax=unclassified Streptomyces TaxID=2593676 RepID=UPI0033B8C5F0